LAALVFDAVAGALGAAAPDGDAAGAAAEVGRADVPGCRLLSQAPSMATASASSVVRDRRERERFMQNLGEDERKGVPARALTTVNPLAQH